MGPWMVLILSFVIPWFLFLIRFCRLWDLLSRQEYNQCPMSLSIITNVSLVLQVLADLVQGEFMQLGSKENENERFAHYLRKTFKKTASLIAYSCKAVSADSGSV